MKHENNSLVRITVGQLEGFVGRITGYDEFFELYLVRVPELAETVVGLDETEIEALADNDNSAAPANEPDMPPAPPFGMSSEDLAQYTADFINRCMTRVTTVGREQYDLGGHQQFEVKSIADVCRMALEEVEDFAVYAAMVHIRVRRTLAAVEEVL
ncbi:hypothetical protein [Kutzneria chonburiensis]|uniref:Uncharacterized protein n=1 Tax=Kutzneria chonburiensis TaxID=1483604 RepID=A0ABV6N3A2_9PSEU|nr:hypothetical protein [Kutzneria chonburiensis]